MDVLDGGTVMLGPRIPEIVPTPVRPDPDWRLPEAAATEPVSMAATPPVGSITAGQDAAEQSDTISADDSGNASAFEGRNLLAENMPSLLLAMGMVMLLWFSMRALRKSRSRERTVVSVPTTVRSPAAIAASRNPSQTAAAQASIERLDEVAANAFETVRRMAAIVDQKARELETLIEDADERIRRISGESPITPASPAAPFESAQAEPVAIMGPPAPSDLGPDQIGQATLDPAPAPVPDKPKFERTAEGRAARRREIKRLAGEGMTAEQIAQKLGGQPGEVRLALLLKD